MGIDKNRSAPRLEGEITNPADEAPVCFCRKGKLSFGGLPETGFKFPLSPQRLVSRGDVSKGWRVIEKAA